MSTEAEPALDPEEEEQRSRLQPDVEEAADVDTYSNFASTSNAARASTIPPNASASFFAWISEA